MSHGVLIMVLASCMPEDAEPWVQPCEFVSTNKVSARTSLRLSQTARSMHLHQIIRDCAAGFEHSIIASCLLSYLFQLSMYRLLADGHAS